jgi:hypothetical protein
LIYITKIDHMKPKFLFLLFILLSSVVYSQKRHIVKTNLLSLVTGIPSFHFEERISNKMSIQFNFHKAQFWVFINENELLNTSLELKLYPSKNSLGLMKGYYVAPGINFSRDYKDKANYIGAITRIGYQKIIKDRLVLDFGGGLVLPFYGWQAKTTISTLDCDLDARFTVGIGYKF